MISNVDTDKKFCVYVHTNKINGKRYVGVTSQDPEKRWNKGKGYTKRQPHMYNAIQKYGWENFNHEILIDGISLEDASSLERMLIKAWQLQNRQFGYNDQSGGLEHSSLSKEIREKIGNAHKGKKQSEEHKKHLSESKKGQLLSEKTKEKIRIALQGRVFTDEHKENLSEALTGREFSKEHKQNISNARKGQFTEKQQEALIKVCENNKGRKHTEEAKAKISAGNKGKLKKNSVRVEQHILGTEETVGVYDSVMEAHNKTGVSYRGIWNCINGLSKSSGGFAWIKIDN